MDLCTKHLEELIPQAKGWFNSLVTGLSQQVSGDTRRPLLLTLTHCFLRFLAFVSTRPLRIGRKSSPSSSHNLDALLSLNPPPFQNRCTIDTLRPASRAKA